MDDKKNGAFTQIPNILFTSYKHLSKEEKFLYCTLKSIYWDLKPRFVSTRELSELTGYSRGALANMLPRLHTCGLVHAEITREKDKDGNEKGNAKYYIIVHDIWDLNKQLLACSPEEQAERDPSLKLVHQMDRNSSPSNGQACPPNDPSLSTKSAKLGTPNGQVCAQLELPKDNKDTFKDKEKDSVPSLSSQKSSEETKPLEVDYPLFDRLCQGKGYAADFKVPRNEKNNAAIQELRSQSATPEQIAFVFNDIWDDKEPFWQQHRGKPSTVASQFTSRVWKMTTPAPKRQTVSGFTNWTEDKTAGIVPSAPKATEKPKEPSLPVGYTRLKIDKPRGPRSLQARLQAQEKGKQQ